MSMHYLDLHLSHTEMKMYAEPLFFCSTWLTSPGIVYPPGMYLESTVTVNFLFFLFNFFLFLIEVSLSQIRVLPWFHWSLSYATCTMQRSVSQWKVKRNNPPILTIHLPILFCPWKGRHSSLKKIYLVQEFFVHLWKTDKIQLIGKQRRKKKCTEVNIALWNIAIFISPFLVCCNN